MSLVSQALVITTAKVLAGRTWAGDQILRQPVDPISSVLRAAPEMQRPTIAIYVDRGLYTGDGRQSQGRQSMQDLKIFVYIPNGEYAGEPGYKFDTSNAGMALDFMARMVDAAFHFDEAEDDPNSWVKIWKKFASRIEERDIRYVLVEVDNGVRVPTAEITYKLVCAPDPAFVGNSGTAFEMFEAKLRTGTPESVRLADLFALMIKNPSTMPDYRALQTNFGLTDVALQATGLAPQDLASTDTDGNTPGLTAVDYTGSATIVPNGES